MEQRNFPGPYVSLYQVLAVLIVFMAMLIVSNGKIDRLQKERDDAYDLLNIEVPKLQERIFTLKATMILREMELQNQYDDMQQVPPRWPEAVLVADKNEDEEE